jgi:hypothetical protein
MGNRVLDSHLASARLKQSVLWHSIRAITRDSNRAQLGGRGIGSPPRILTEKFSAASAVRARSLIRLIAFSSAKGRLASMEPRL